jgi:flagellar basal-body rod protein FlgF
MDSGYYAAVAALKGRMQALDLTANNLANANTNGFRAQRERFQSILMSSQGDALSDVVGQYGVLAGSEVDLSQGELQRTGGDLDMALQGSGFFVVQTANGLRYTRDGAFRTDKDGVLLDASGNKVLGQAGEIRLPSGTITVGEDGTIAVNDAVVARFKVVQPSSAGVLTPASGSQFTADAKEMKDVAQPRVRQGFIEGANVTPVEGAVALVNLQRQAEMMERVLSIFHTDFNRTAIEDVAKG